MRASYCTLYSSVLYSVQTEEHWSQSRIHEVQLVSTSRWKTYTPTPSHRSFLPSVLLILYCSVLLVLYYILHSTQ